MQLRSCIAECRRVLAVIKNKTMGDKGMKEYCFGIDVGGTTVKMGLFRVDGELLEKWEIPSRTENEPVCRILQKQYRRSWKSVELRRIR